MFDEERRRVDAWAKVFKTDGFEAAQEAERQEIALIRKEKDENDLRNFKAFEKMMMEGKAVKDAREKERNAALGVVEGGLIDQENVSENNNAVNQFSGEAVLPTKESPALKVIREQRLADALSGRTSQMVEAAMNAKASAVSAPEGGEVLEDSEVVYDSKAEWTKCTIEEVADEDQVGARVGGKQAPAAIDLNDIDLDDDDDVAVSDFQLDATPEAGSLSLLAAALDPAVPLPLVPAGSTDLFELD